MLSCTDNASKQSSSTEAESDTGSVSENTDSETEKNEQFTLEHTAIADFSDKDGSPLVKKFGMFDSGLVSVSRTKKHLPLIEAIDAESFRVELGMGRGDMLFHDLVKEKDGSLKYNWTGIDKIAKDLNSHGVLPYWACGYCPYPLQSKGDSREQPKYLEGWKNICADIAAHFRSENIRIGYHEVWNEPDCFDVFYLGGWNDYLQLYKYGATGIREGDPDAVVGGPSTAFVMDPGSNYKKFIDFVEENELPLDYFSMHRYGTDYKDKISLGLKGLPFRNGTVHVYRIDKEHSELGESLALCETAELSDSSIFEWNGTVPGYGIVYFEINDGTGISDLSPVSLGDAVIVRKEHYFPDSTATSAENYAYFDEETWTARLGSGSDGSYLSTTGVLVKDLPERITASFTLEDGLSASDNNSLLGLRIDYETDSGYTHSVLYHGGIYSESRTDDLPWGTMRSADKVIRTELDSFTFSPSENAPDGWTGRVLISFHMQNCGTDKNIKVTLR